MIASPSTGTQPRTPPLEVAPFDTPTINVMDLGLTRGDGIFETVGIHRGIVHAREAHAERFKNSARLLDLPEPNTDAYSDALDMAIELLGPVDEAYSKYVMTRGIEGSDLPTGYVYMDVNPDFSHARTAGISVITLSRGYPLDIATTAPWLLQGAKTLSYAINRAVLREAARRGADDVLFTTSDGYLLEGPTSSVILRFGDEIVTTRPDQGVLQGTAQLGTFAFFESRGYSTSYRSVSVAELAHADALWLTNSQRLAAPVSTLDGRSSWVDAELTRELNEFLANRTA
jgi:4-amino-4-deoxychorismate lyase